MLQIGQKRIKGPCMDCPDRHIGCHADCSAYAEWKQEMLAAEKYSGKAEQMFKTNAIAGIIDRNNAKRLKKMPRYKWRGGGTD